MKNRVLQPLSVFLISLLFYAFCACSANDTSEKNTDESVEEEPVNYVGAELVQVDSIMIDILGELGIYDYNPKTKLFLAGDIQKGGIIFMGRARKNFNALGHLIINQQGEIIHQFKHIDRGPEGHGPSALDNFFIGDSAVGVFSKVGLLQYGLDGSFQKKYAEINTQDVIGFSQRRIAVANNHGKLGIGLAKGQDEATRAWDSLYQIVKPLRFYDLNKFETGYEDLETGMMSMYGFPDHPFFAPESEYDVAQLPPRVVKNPYTGEVYVQYAELQELEVYDLETGGFLNKIDLEPEYFGEPVKLGSYSGGINGYEGLAWLNRGGRMANSYYKDMVQIGEYTLLRYSKALPEEQVNRLIADGGPGKSEDWPRIRRQHYRFYYQLFKNGKKVVPDFELPDFEPQEWQSVFRNHRNLPFKIVGGDGLNRVYVYVPNNGDDGGDERDYELIRVYELRLIAE